MKIPRWQMFLIWAVSLVFLFSGCSGSSGTGPVSTPTVSPSPAVTPTPAGSPSPTPGPVHNLTRDKYYSTIQGAIDDAQSGDEIVVSPGVYHENIDFQGKNIVLRSSDPENQSVVAQTVIDGGWNGSVVTFQGGETNQAVLNGFTIRNGSGKEDFWCYAPTYCPTVYLGGGIYIKDSSPSILRNVIQENVATAGGGIYMEGASFPRIVQNTIANNQAGDYGGGIGVRDTSSPIVHQNVIHGNQLTGETGLPNPFSLPIIGGGIYVESSASVQTIGGSTWPRLNSPPAGTQIGATWTYQNNTFFGNTNSGGAVDNGCHVYFK